MKPIVKYFWACNYRYGIERKNEEIAKVHLFSLDLLKVEKK